MYKKIQRLWFNKPILFSIFVKKLNYVLIFKLIIKEIRRETKDAVSILLTSWRIKVQIRFYCRPIPQFTFNDKEIRRAYSICSSQKVVNYVSIKAVKTGVLSVCQY
jgi:hypothetical protein